MADSMPVQFCFVAICCIVLFLRFSILFGVNGFGEAVPGAGGEEFDAGCVHSQYGVSSFSGVGVHGRVKECINHDRYVVG